VVSRTQRDNLVVACPLTHGAVADVVNHCGSATKTLVSANYATHGGNAPHVIALILGCITHL
jgi:hypothetical protein